MSGRNTIAFQTTHGGGREYDPFNTQLFFNICFLYIFRTPGMFLDNILVGVGGGGGSGMPPDPPFFFFNFM